MKTMMSKKNWFWALVALCLLLASAALADDGLGVLTDDVQADPAVAAAVQAELPGAVIDHIYQATDDGRTEWDVIFRTADGGLGSCTVKSGSYAVRDIHTYYDLPAGMLDAEAALQVLRDLKGDFTVTELEVDYDEGYLCYEGEAELDGRWYEFEVTVEGRVIEWSRD